jgi:hypothetical protein
MGSGVMCNSRWRTFYSPLAILTALTLRAVFRLAYRQAEGLSSSIISLLGLTLGAPDHTTLSRRSATLAVPRRSEEGDSTRFFSKNFGARMQGDVVKIPEGTPRSPKRAGGPSRMLPVGVRRSLVRFNSVEWTEVEIADLISSGSRRGRA